jgi:hypothetical protein
MNIRESVLAGSWYQSNPEMLKKEINRYLDAVKMPDNVPKDVGALVLPHAGYQYSGACAAYGYSLIKGKSYKRVIIMGPSHRVGFSGVSVSKSTHYETPLGKVPVDRIACDALLKHDKLFSYNPAADKNEHSVEIQLPFLQAVLAEGYKIVPLVVGEADDLPDTASAIKGIVDKDTLVIASSDFTHLGADFGYEPFKDPPDGRAGNIKDNLKKLDGGAIDQIVKLSPDGFDKYIRTTEATVCGYKPILILLNIINFEPRAEMVPPVLLNYYTSGDLSGDYSHCVSYAAIGFFKQGATRVKEDAGGAELDKSEQEALLKMARQTLKLYLNDKKTPKFNEKELTARLKEKRGIFVTLKNCGELRGCIGQIFDPEPLYQEVIDYTVNSTRDSRFYYHPVTAKEEKDIDIEISVLSPMRKVASYNDIVVGRHGVYLTKGGANAVFLPQVAPEQGWTRDEMLNQLAQKAGLDKDAWRKGADFMVFTAQVFGEKD